ncbi:hypothetical protein ACJ41O_013881 [Fusarium nematophilum]
MSQSTAPTAIAHFDSAAVHYEASTGGCTRELVRSLLALPQLKGIYQPDAIVLDNACGTGIVAEEIVLRARQANTTLPLIHAVDPAPNMVGITRKKLAALKASGVFSAAVMPGEKLEFPDGTFTHSITNLGILFFIDGVAGAKEIYRTLKPGSVAIVTSWSTLGYLENVIHPAQSATRPDDPPYKLPIPELWLGPSYVEQCLKEGGFEQISISTSNVHYGAASADDLLNLLLNSFKMIWKDWPEEDQRKFRDAARERVNTVSQPYTMNDGGPGVGIPMTAIVGVCEK